MPTLALQQKREEIALKLAEGEPACVLRFSEFKDLIYAERGSLSDFDAELRAFAQKGEFSYEVSHSGRYVLFTPLKN